MLSLLNEGVDIIIRTRVLVNGVDISLEKAVASGYILIKDCTLLPQENVQIMLSSSLYDKNGYELFENDIVMDERGEQFTISFHNGTFFAVKKAQDKTYGKIPLYLLQSNGHIPVTIIK